MPALGSPKNGLRILVVEDEPANQELMRAFIETSSASYLKGAEVLTAESLAAAREMLAPGGIDVVLLDIGLPDGDGLQLVKELGQGARPRVIVVSGSVFPVERRAALSTGADEFIAKPIEGEALVKTIGAVMARRTVLVVEDYEDLRDMVYEALTAAGYHVLLAKDGATALKVAASETSHIDLVLTDYFMPNMLGTELAEKMKEQHARMRVIFMSGSPLPSGQLGIDPGTTVLQKPFLINELTEKVKAAIEAPEK
jgi:DNA-binding response OmpR family regulator